LNPYFENIYRLLEQQRAEILYKVKEISDEKFRRQPAPGKWSIAEILTHIIVAEQLSLGYMKKKANAIEQLSNSGASEFLRLQVLKISQRIPVLKFRAPKIVVSNTPPAYSFAELSAQWQIQREELKQFLESIPNKDVRKVLYKHPIAGRFDAAQAMVFFREHIIHHLPQVKRLL
jgi:hypothetical protein